MEGASASTYGRDADPDSKVHGANMGPIWGRQGPGGPHVGPMKLAIWGGFLGAGSKLVHINGLVQDCSISSTLAMEIMQSCTKPSIYIIFA